MTTADQTYDFNQAVNAAFSGEFAALCGLVRRFAKHYAIDEDDGWGILAYVICDRGYKDERLCLGQWYARCQYFLFDPRGGNGMARDQALNLKRGWKRKHSNHAAAQGCSLSEAQADLESSAVASWAVSKAPTLEVNGRAVSLDGALEVALRLAAEDPDDKHIHAAVARLVHGDDRRVADELGLAVDSVRTYVQRGKEKLHAAYHRTGKYAPGATAR